MDKQVAEKIAFNEQSERRYQEALEMYPTKEAALLPVLWIAMDQFGALPTEVLEYVSSRLDLPPVRVFSAVEFYTMFYREPRGRYHIQVCRNLSCTLRGSEQLMGLLEGKLGIQPGETTEDGNFSIETAECLGSCGTAPVMRVNDTYYEDLTIEKLEKIIEGCLGGRSSSELLG
ncbi:MAG: NADH-quinone oxidoreductase subunit NuoE [Candidatus Latescibacteria bacterium]|nr:NADH-quinone oxidoreductase subunit NuoE [Candidatus Latescibacterota bacterium]NIM21998.1 NADH-quinone oxidoreductase subunit NuoE [Candidatus Latescibacterota bacterium]NIM66016.1 NADH-quinone oxidoreductase subunit NuoE [Candidatus Latescibacterota bacterium]NIO02424.1 NADH-quinone oxidoreductase subunit NuoE [Candidatus Latescibacterota bacterium]NIO29335.1 NADH-quinone oxidoreductase subunit NuoE [Candidatus Latescibacterota bacterium]